MRGNTYAMHTGMWLLKGGREQNLIFTGVLLGYNIEFIWRVYCKARRENRMVEALDEKNGENGKTGDCFWFDSYGDDNYGVVGK